MVLSYRVLFRIMGGLSVMFQLYFRIQLNFFQKSGIIDCSFAELLRK